MYNSYFEHRDSSEALGVNYEVKKMMFVVSMSYIPHSRLTRVFMAICSLHVLRCGCLLYVSIFVDLLIHIFNRQDTAPHLPLQAGSTVSLNTRQRYQNQPPDLRI